MDNKQFRPATLALAVCAVLGATGSLATAKDSTSATMLEEVVVTGSRFSERIFDSHASLSVINEEALARSTAPSLAEVLRDLPSVQVTDSGQPGLGRIRIRGEESRRTAVLINGQEVTDHYEVGTPLTLHPSMVERVELIRGSGSLLYGSRALSGVVNFITRKGGTQPLQATLSGVYDSATEGYNSFASVFGNVEGTEYRLAWSQSDHDERATPAGRMENTQYDNQSLYLYAGREFGEHRFDYTYEDYESASHVFVEEEVKTNFPLTDFYLETPRRDRQKHGLFYRWEADNNWLSSVEANAFHQQSKRHFYTFSETIWYARDIDSFNDLDSDGALVQLNLRSLGDHKLITGLQYVSDEVDQTRHVDTLSWTPERATTGIEVIRDKANIDTWAWFVQDQWAINDDLTLTGGLREYYVDGKLSYSDRDSLSAGSLGDDQELIGAVGLVWGVNDHLRLRTNVAQGYLYPSLSQLATGAYAGSQFVNPDQNLAPETSVNYELGLRLQRGDLLLDVTAFYTESEDYIHHLPCAEENNCPGSRDRFYTNIGESKAHGVELYLSYDWQAAAIQPYATLTWMERRNDYSEFSTWDTGTPELAGRAGLRWEGLLEGGPGLWTDLYLRGESDSEVREPGNVRDVLEDKQDWITVNFSGGVELGDRQQYQLTLELLNLTDKEYIASTENLFGAERSAAIKLTLNL